jgi:nucleotide-binding universal stress UspA family protein
MSLKKILVATDFSPEASAALDVALELAHASGGAVTLLHIVQMPAYSFANGTLYVPSPELVDDIIGDARRALDSVKQRCLERGSAVETHWAQGDPAAEIVRFADERGFDIIVVGTHGRRGLRRLMLGSVAEQVLRAAAQPVVSVRARPPAGGS